jgi:mxaJ protein
MSSLFLRALALAALIVATTAPVGAGAQGKILRVCADPNNLPFSNEREEGFENRIVRVIAAELGADVRYTWWAQRRGFIRNTLNAGVCDLVAGVSVDSELVLTTPPYYRSSYVAVARPDLQVVSLDDPVLRTLRIGVQMVGDDFANTPPAHALSRRGIIDNIVGYLVYGDYAEADPAARIVHAVAAGEIDVALVWGPIGGYFAAREDPPLAIAPLLPGAHDGLPFAFGIAMGVRKGDEALRATLTAALARRKPEIDGILAAYHVPRVNKPDMAGAAR